MAICRYCGQQKKLCKAHVIPRAFYKHSVSSYKDKRYVELSTKESRYRILQNGCWDDNILCSDCDNSLNEYDKEAYNLLFQNLNNHKLIIDQDSCIYEYNKSEFDYIKLSNFFISLIWRASISNKELFELVNLGTFENTALDILKGNINRADYFKVAVFREPDGFNLDKIVLVEKYKLAAKTTYKFYFSQFQVDITPSMKDSKWDSKQIGTICNQTFLNPNKFIIIEGNEVYRNKKKVEKYIQR